MSGARYRPETLQLTARGDRQQAVHHKSSTKRLGATLVERVGCLYHRIAGGQAAQTYGVSQHQAIYSVARKITAGATTEFSKEFSIDF
jgi:hypothetical protein